ncbi:MAG: hypothetical protein ABS76_26480 [Pelagibacterium sp. SCN 64-44]|jgi:hypothetical protein|nr:MAG: hypothetical protein ABS76_26480 [Pelagibacterium sp. SCN 64-44]
MREDVLIVAAVSPRALAAIKEHLSFGQDTVFVLMGSSVPAVRAKRIYVFGATSFRFIEEASSRAVWAKRGDWLQYHLRPRLAPGGEWIEI